jgi:hypothetical protein
MVPDIYTHEKLALEHREQLQREAAAEQVLGELPERSSHAMRHMAASLGSFLIALGTRLKQLEQSRKQMAFD